MPTLIDKELERAIERRLSIAPKPVAPAARPRVHAPVVRFSPMLAEGNENQKRRRRWMVACSIGAHVLLIVTVVLMPKRAQTVEDPDMPLQIVFTMPAPPVSDMPHPPIPKPAPAPKAKTPQPEPPKPVAEAPKPEPPKVKELEPAPLPPPVAKAPPPKPKAEVKVGLLDEAPAGPSIVASKNSRSTVVMSGFDTMTGSPAMAPRSGRVVETAFEAAPEKTHRGTAAGTVRESGFGEEAAPAPKKRERERPLGALDVEVEILSKPKPVYTDEARALKIEGDVVLDVRFESSGRVVVLGVASGLGHGLDEAAAEAARKIQFNPARRDGSPVDQVAKLRVVFRLA